jgi:phytoene synthase
MISLRTKRASGIFVIKPTQPLEGRPSGDDVIDTFVELYHEKGFEKSWVDAFLHSMGLDLVKSEYDTLEETLEYIYGSAEVIGLFMCAIMGLPEESYHHACMMGRNMQYINFIRDINEDIGLGRRYFPKKHKTSSLLIRKQPMLTPRIFEVYAGTNPVLQGLAKRS